MSHDDDVTQEIAGAYYENEITFGQLKELESPEAAANFRVLEEHSSEEFLNEAAEELADS